MSLEVRVTKLESRVDLLEEAFHENNKILEATHGVVSLILNEQREKFWKLEERFDKIDKRFDKQESFNQTVNENFKQLEILITQLHPGH